MTKKIKKMLLGPQYKHIYYRQRKDAINAHYNIALKIMKYFSQPSSLPIREKGYLRDMGKFMHLTSNYSKRCDPAVPGSCHHSDPLITNCRFGHSAGLTENCTLFTPTYSSKGLVSLMLKPKKP